jgi:hypothetical protein
MRRIILAVAILAAVANAIEITGFGGGNNQKIGSGTGDMTWEGFGWHGGVLLGLGVTPFRLPITIGGESGLVFHQENYEREPWFGTEYTEYNNLMASLLLNAKVQPFEILYFGLGLGPSLSYPLSGRYWTDYETDEWPTEIVYERDELNTYINWQVKGELGIKIIPRLWLKPSITGSVKIWQARNYLYTDKSATFFSLGLALKL